LRASTNSENIFPKIKASFSIVFWLIIFLVLYEISSTNYLLFHIIAELFSIIIAFTIFLIGWNTKDIAKQNFFQHFSISALAIGLFDLIHMLVYKGMNIVEGYGANLPTQLWIIARYFQAISIIVAIFVRNRENSPVRTLMFHICIIIFLLWITFAGIFPDCYIEGQGLTPFKIISEYIIISILFIAGGLFWRKKSDFNPSILKMLYISLVFSIFAEFAFTMYVSVFGISNLIGHFFKIIAFIFIYNALIQKNLKQPYALLFKNLKDNEVNLKTISEFRKQILTNVSHELKTPLTAIKLSINNLKKYGNKLEEVKKQHLFNIMEENTSILHTMIEDLLISAKIEQKTISIKFQTMSLTSTIKHTLIQLHPILKKKNLKLITELANIDIWGDNERIGQVIRIIMDNAIKYSPENAQITVKLSFFHNSFPQTAGVSPPASSLNLKVQLSEKEKYFDPMGIAIIQVIDEGIGIPKTELSLIFEQFFRSNKVEGINGVGLGLFIANKIVGMHHGQIIAESLNQKGAIFKIFLPIDFREGL
jgi:signal transduction histidine kinase